MEYANSLDLRKDFQVFHFYRNSSGSGSSQSSPLHIYSRKIDFPVIVTGATKFDGSNRLLIDEKTLRLVLEKGYYSIFTLNVK